MVLISVYGYRFAEENLREVENSKLDVTARINVQLVNNWFLEAERDGQSWAGLPMVKEGLLKTSKEYKESALPLKTYIQSPQYKETIKPMASLLGNLTRHYTYMYDVLLVDVDENILVSTKHEADLGTNLNDEAYANTRFARAVRESLRDKKSHFSDTEAYVPSNGILTGFITVPVLDDSHNILGILAIKLNLKNMTDQLKRNSEQDLYFSHYLVGSDGLLRTKRQSIGGSLNERITTRMFWNWKKEHGSVASGYSSDMKEVAIVYNGPDDELVLGKHYNIDILGVKWAHISEIKAEKAFSATRYLAIWLLFILCLATLLIVVVAVYLSRRITRPILALREAALSFTSGKRKTEFIVESNNEIGDLSIAFSNLVKKQLADAHEIGLLAQVVAANPYPKIITDKNGIIEYVNDVMVHESRYTRSELIGMKMTSFRSRKHDEAYYADLWDTIGVKKISWQGELSSKIKSGEMRDWKTTAYPLLSEEGSVANYVFIVEDVTEQNIKDRLFVMQSRQAQMGEMISMIAHQWRQPLAIINSLAGQLLFSNMMKEEPDVQLEENIRKIEDQSLHLSRTINDFRDFFSPDKQQEEVLCSKMVENAVQLVDHAIKGASLSFELKVIQDSLITTYANEIMQVLITLIKNSLDAFESNKIQGRYLIITISQSDSNALILIEDNAGGIDSDIIENIFLPYFTTKGEESGTGLGLYMAKMVVEEHCNGKLSVDSMQEKTTFTIALPLK